jgi:hypothetical protein
MTVSTGNNTSYDATDSSRAPPALPKKAFEAGGSEKKEIQIAARAKGSQSMAISRLAINTHLMSSGPGPAAYNLPPTIGLNAKTKGPRSPAYSFGMKLKILSRTKGKLIHS